MRFALRSCVFGALLALALPLCAETLLKVTRQLLMPDGAPAAGARVVIRTFNEQGLLQELETRAGPNGVVEATVRYEAPTSADAMSPHGPVSNGYLMVDMPGCALGFYKVATQGPPLPDTGMGTLGHMGGGMAGPPPGGQNTETFLTPPDGRGGQSTIPAIRLMPAYLQDGVLLNKATNAPVAGATVFAISLEGTVPTNLHWANIRTKELVATTDANGKFSLRGVSAESLGGFGMPGVAGGTRAVLGAYAAVEGKVLAAQSAIFAFSARPRPQPQQLLLEPTFALQGTVINAMDRKPVRGMSVRLYGLPGEWLSAQPAVITDAEGRYRFPVLLPLTSAYLVNTHPDYTVEVMALPLPGRQRGAPVAAHPDLVTAPDLVVRPMGPVTTVRLVDETTGNPPLTPMSLSPQINLGLFVDHIGWIGRDRVFGSMRANGLVSLRMPLGTTDTRASGIGYEGRASIEAPANGTPVMRVARRKGLLLQFTTRHPQGVDGCLAMVRAGDGQLLPVNPIAPWNGSGFVFVELHARSPAGPYAVTVMRRNSEACPWTPITPDAWPNVIAVR